VRAPYIMLASTEVRIWAGREVGLYRLHSASP
jgi:hypothetical protein